MSKSIDAFLDRKIERLERIQSIYGGFEKDSDQYTYELLKELREYRRLKTAGLILRLPCKVGDTVYMPWKFDNTEGVAALTVISIIVGSLRTYIETDLFSDCVEFLTAYNYGQFGVSNFGKTVFLTREAAEQALKEA